MAAWIDHILRRREALSAVLGPLSVIVSAALYGAAFPPYEIPELAYVFAIPLLLWAMTGQRLRGEGWIVFGSGWAVWAWLLSWLRFAPQAAEVPFGVVLGWLAVAGLSAILAVFWWMWAMAALRVLRFTREFSLRDRMAAMLGLAALWILLEWIRGFIFTGFPWLPLAASQWQRPLLLQVIAWTGAYGLSFVLMLFNLGLAFYLHSILLRRRVRWWKRLSYEFYLALFFLFLAIGVGMYGSGLNQRERIPGPRLGFVQPNAGVSEKWDQQRFAENLQTLEQLTEYAGFLGAELVLWPESPMPLPVLGNDDMRNWVESIARDFQLPLLIGGIARIEGEHAGQVNWYNAVFVVDPETGLQESFYAKRQLVPFGEYVPMGSWLPFVRRLVHGDGDFSAGRGPNVLDLGHFDPRVRRVGSLLCYEDIFPLLARTNVLAGAAWHFVPTNNVWFGEGGGAVQHAAHSVLRAVETRRPVVRCGNAGWSGWIDEWGHVRHVMRDNRNSIFFQGVQVADFSVSAHWNGRRSFYVRFGDWVIVLAALLLPFCLLPLLRRSENVFDSK